MMAEYDCKYYDKELDCCKWFSDWKQPMPVLQPCIESPCEHYTRTAERVEMKSSNIKQLKSCPMCGDCQYAKICQDENGELFSFCCNRKSENFLKEISFAFDNCDYGKVEDYGEE